MRLSLGVSPEREPAGAGPQPSGRPDEQATPEIPVAADASAPRRKRLLSRNFVLGSLLVVLTLAVYGQVCGFNFIVLDDPSYVKWNRYVLDGLKPSSLKWAITQFNDSNWIPLTWLSLMLDATVYGQWPDGYHITNVALHVANVLLVFFVFNRMTQSPTRSAFVAALFAIHPLHAESVAWVTERKDVLCTLFGLLSLGAYVRYAGQHRRSQYVAAFCFLVLSLLAKQTYVTLPCVFLLLDYWPLGRFGTSGAWPTDDVPQDAPIAERRTSFGRLVVEKIPFLLLSAAFSAIAVWAQSGGGIRSLEAVPFRARVLNAIAAYGWYAWKALVPLDLAIFYPHPVESLRPLDVMVQAAFLVVATGIALFNVRRRPYLIVGWLWYLGTLFPLIGLIQIGKQRVADRYAYLPLLGLYLAVAWLIPSLVPSGRLRRWLLPTAAVAAIAVYATLGFRQVALWGDDVKLFQHALAVTENNAMSRCSLGCALLGNGDVKGAIENIEDSLRLDPSDALAHDDLGSAYQSDKRLEDAAREYRKSIALKEDSASPHEGLGTVLSEWHQYPEARKEFERALEIEPNASLTYFNLARLCDDVHEYDQSLEYARRGLEIDPKNVECQRQIAHVLSAQGKTDEAFAAFQKVAKMSPSDLESRVKMREIMDKKLKSQSSTN
ncbi:MAG TPA: tetratricopeptide repeat protein [Planctomycetaceae bacterium]|nr:tetratricopeptide repeat protein [Planctomycetaceae bacterium]